MLLRVRQIGQLPNLNETGETNNNKIISIRRYRSDELETKANELSCTVFTVARYGPQSVASASG